MQDNITNQDHSKANRFTVLRTGQPLLLVLSILLLHQRAVSFAPPDPYVSNLTGFYSNGQVFLTWNKVQNQFAYYKIYRATTAITMGSELLNSEYLGCTNSTSALDNDLSKHDNVNRYFVIEQGSGPLNSIKGLFVATTLSNGNYYYAVTTVINGTEDITLVSGSNTLQNPIAETVAAPQPVFQQTRTLSFKTIEIYATFLSTKHDVNKPLMNSAGFIANDFALYRNGAVSGKHPLRIRFHGGGADFLSNITSTQSDELNINPEYFLPCGKHTFWWGANENFNIFSNDSNATPPVTGLNYDFTQQQITRLIDWAIVNLPVDTNRIYLDGSSMGSVGAYSYAITYPERIAAVKLGGGVFDGSFQDDAYPGCSLNEGNFNRVDGDKQFGQVSTNLMSNSGLFFYEQLNGNWVTNTYKEKDYPVMYSINGKNDTIVGWTEKTIYYQSLNTSHVGGYYFWDKRKHGGGSMATWNDLNFNLLRYKRNVSFPAFANCSTNEDYGDGSAASGEDYGTVNGFLDWKDNNIVDDTSLWKVDVFLRALSKMNGTEQAPEFCTVDVTPRRLQNLKIESGETITWTVKHNNLVTQSGSFVYAGGLITIPDVVVYKDTVSITLVRETGTEVDTIDRNISGVAIIPNIFEDNTSIQWNMSKPGRCTVSVYDFQGRCISILLAQEQGAGSHQVIWNAADADGKPLRPGVYFIRLETGSSTETKKCVIAR